MYYPSPSLPSPYSHFPSAPKIHDEDIDKQLWGELESEEEMDEEEVSHMIPCDVSIAFDSIYNLRHVTNM